MRVARDPLHAVDRPPIALCSLFVKGEQRRRFEGKHGASRQQRIGAGNLRIGRARRRDIGEAGSHQAKEGIGGEMLASFGGNDAPGKPHHENIVSFKSERYCRMDVYEKATGMLGWVLGGGALRELLHAAQAEAG
jgi:hypothetical protein